MGGKKNQDKSTSKQEPAGKGGGYDSVGINHADFGSRPGKVEKKLKRVRCSATGL